ncbi:polysaccharide biosynthesis tyrosine autokinase [Modestobacter sp. NPDC049651]|uniref:polysaccharide biosynthesis tyrosine autokinase n=1 Tax=unclassified Modestobacter TaxID=2643866 RepID=UPI0033CFF772
MSNLRRHRLLVLAAVVLGVVAAALLTSLTPRSYSSSTKLFVTAARGTDPAAAYEGNLFTQQRVTSYVQILTNQQLAQAVVDELALPMTAAELAGEVTASATTGTVVLDVSVTDGDARRAQRIAAALGRQFTSRVTALEQPDGAATSAVTVRTLQPATYDATPVGPDLVGNLWRGGAVGLVLGLLLAVARGKLDRWVRTDAQVREAAGVGLLGRVHDDRGLGRAHVVTALPARSPSVDDLRAIAAALLTDDAVRRQVVLVAGCLPGDGASTVAVNVALSLARLGNRVLVVDADLRRPRAARSLGVADGPGLTEVLAGTLPVEQAVRGGGGGLLSVLPAGTLHPNPGDLLGSPVMRVLVEELRASYDVVVIDAPPVLPLVDAALMGSALADGCVLVVRHGRTSRRQLAEAADRLTAVHAPLLGVVLDRVPRGEALTAAGGRAYRPDAARAGAPLARAVGAAAPAGGTPTTGGSGAAEQAPRQT